MPTETLQGIILATVAVGVVIYFLVYKPKQYRRELDNDAQVSGGTKVPIVNAFTKSGLVHTKNNFGSLILFRDKLDYVETHEGHATSMVTWPS